MFQTNKIKVFPSYIEVVFNSEVVPNLAVNVKEAVQNGLVSPLAIQPTYGEEELSEGSINGHYIDDPLDMLNAAKNMANSKVAADSVPLSSNAPNPKKE